MLELSTVPNVRLKQDEVREVNEVRGMGFFLTVLDRVNRLRIHLGDVEGLEVYDKGLACSGVCQ